MNELQRQAYLQAMGFTPWVAAQPLPGAAPTPVLDMPADGAPQAAPEPAAAAPAPAPQPAATAVAAPPAAATPAPDTPAAAPAEPPLCMHACPLGDVLVLVEQEPADAPDLGRDARELLDNLLRALKRPEQRRRRFDWPMAHGIGGTLEDFLVQFCQSMKSAQVLLCVSDDTAQRLLGAPRYDKLEKQGLQWLAISSLTEMLGDPVAHKRRSWEAIKQAGLQLPAAG